VFKLSRNRLTGTIPNAFADMKRLRIISMGANAVQGNGEGAA
jgi:hypothetical protein